MNWLSRTVLPKIKALVSPGQVKDNLWIKCTACNQMIFHREYEENFNTCSTCGGHMPLSPARRIEMLFDDGDGEVITAPASADDPLNFRDMKRYSDRLKDARSKTSRNDALLIAAGTIKGKAAVITAFDFSFMGGSMGQSVGNGIVTAVSEAIRREAALIIVPSSGGARMQEGILSLMQLPRTIIAIDRLREAGLPYIALLAHPTTGGVTASFGMLGDIHIAEPGAIIGFAGKRVIEETVREQLPDGFQSAEYLEEHGMVDMVIPRGEQRDKIGSILSLLMKPPSLVTAE